MYPTGTASVGLELPAPDATIMATYLSFSSPTDFSQFCLASVLNMAIALTGFLVIRHRSGMSE